MSDGPPIFGLPAFGRPFHRPFGSPFSSKSGGFTPNDIPNLELWLKSDTGVTTVSSAVSVWEDQSGNVRNATQTTASRRPDFIASGINSLPMVGFDGVDTTGTFMSVDLSFLAATDLSIYSVLRRSSSKVNNFFIGTAPAAVNQGLHAGWETDGGFTLDFFSNDFDLLVPTFTTNLPVIARTRFSSASGVGKDIQLIRSGVATAGSTGLELTPLISASNGVIGRGFPDATTYFDGDMSEIFMYSRFVSVVEDAKIIDYFSKRYSLAVP